MVQAQELFVLTILNFMKEQNYPGVGEDLHIFNESENINKRFNLKISGIDYDSKYIFSDLGYNFLPLNYCAFD